MLSALARKSVTDLSQRRSRAFFAAATLALAVASLGIFALPALMDRSMNAEVKAGRLADLTAYTSPLVLDATRLRELRALPNVVAVEPRAFLSTQVYVGERRAPAYVVGVRNFARQRVDVVHVEAGAAPRTDEVLTETQNAKRGTFGAHTGDSVRILGTDGLELSLRVSGVGRNLNGGKWVTDNDAVVLYTSPRVVQELGGAAGYNSLHFRLADTRPAAVVATARAVRTHLRGVDGFTGFSALPDVRAPGDWPGKTDFQKFTKFFVVVTVLALLSAFVLIANTMTTLVAEQTGEIATMKAVGGRRRQIAAVYVKTALLLGAVGTCVGLVLGVLLSNVLVRFLGSTFYAIDVGFGVDWRVLAASALVGVVGPALAALPAIRRAIRAPLREGLEATGSAVGSQDAGDRLLRRVRFLPRTAQIGLRGVGRRRRRSLATAVMVALAVGNLLAIMGLAAAVANTTHVEWRDHGENVKLVSQGRPFDDYANSLIRSTPGVGAVEPMSVVDARLSGKDGYIWSVRSKTVFRYRIADGRWYTPTEARAKARVAVVERNIARSTGTRVGDRVSVETAAGTVALRVIGIATNQQENGTALFVPLTTMHELLPGVSDDYWIRTTSHDHALVDRTTTSLEDTLASAGYDVSTEIEYVGEADNVAENRTITTTLAVLGFLIVAISLVGLANALTMSVIERTREIGILRTIGARRRDVRRIFATESVALATGGWLLGVPLGYLLDVFLVWLVREVVNVEVPLAFPFWNVVVALVGTVLLALLITFLPIRRAVRFKPGDALRYA